MGKPASCASDATVKSPTGSASSGLPTAEGAGPERPDRVEALRVLIAEDHPVFRDGLRALLSSIRGTEVVGEATTGIEAVEEALRLQPDVVVMDLDLPDLDGVRATRRIVANSPQIGVLVLT